MSNTSTILEREPWYLDTRLLDLDPDVAELFAEVRDILRQARNRLPRRLIPGPGHPRTGSVREFDPQIARGRPPPTMPGTGRGPPGTPQPDRKSRMRPSRESEVMPVLNITCTPLRVRRHRS